VGVCVPPSQTGHFGDAFPSHDIQADTEILLTPTQASGTAVYRGAVLVNLRGPCHISVDFDVHPLMAGAGSLLHSADRRTKLETRPITLPLHASTTASAERSVSFGLKGRRRRTSAT